MEENKSEAPEYKSGPAENAISLRKRFPTLGDLFAMFGITIGAQIVVGVVMMLVAIIMGQGVDLREMDPVMLGRIMAVVYFCSMSLSLWGVIRYRKVRGGGGPVGNFSLRRLNPVLLLWAFAFMLAAGVVLEPVMSLLPAPPNQELGRGLWTALMLVIMAPVFEELICRGVVLGSLRAKYGVVVAWFGSSLFFAVLHLQPTLVLNAFVLGLIMGFIYIATDSLWATIILHALNNALAYVMMTLGHGDTMLIDMVDSRTLYVLIYIGALAVTAVSAYMTWRTLSRLKEAEKNQAEA